MSAFTFCDAKKSIISIFILVKALVIMEFGIVAKLNASCLAIQIVIRHEALII